MHKERITTGIHGLDHNIDFLRAGENVIWQIDDIAEYIYVANRFVTSIARTHARIVYICFSGDQEIIDAQGLGNYGSNVQKYYIDPHLGFETFSFRVYTLLQSEPEETFFVFDCISDLQKYWFSDNMVANFIALITPFIASKKDIAYMAIKYKRHTYRTIDRTRAAVPVLINIRKMHNCVYILPTKVQGRYTNQMYLPLRIQGFQEDTLTSSADCYALFDMYTQTGEQRDCWYKMFDNFVEGSEDVTDEDGISLRENILQCLLGTEPKRLALCRKYFTTQDLINIQKREIGTGCIGGKSTGMLLARNIIRDKLPELYARHIEPHDSYFIGADVFYTYAVENGIWNIRIQMVNPEDYLRVAPEGHSLLLNGTFSEEIKEQFRSMLEYFGQSPIIVRSSSLLEDGFGNAFPGKYESVFCPNQGSLEERYEKFEEAVRRVYASTLNKGAILYRTERNLLQRDEQMALLVMRVAGDQHGKYFYPHVAGVGHSKNLYSNQMGENNKGMLRLVFGLGTRAVDREADDYARIINLNKPTAPMNVEYGDEYKYSQHNLDTINLVERCFDTVPIEKINKDDLRTDPLLLFERDYATEQRFRDMGISHINIPQILNFNDIIKKSNVCSTMKKLLEELEISYGYPVDIEYACNFKDASDYRINLLQCRTLQTKGLGSTGHMREPDIVEYIFKTTGNFMGGNILTEINYVVFVHVKEYLRLSEQKKYEVAREIGRLNAELKDKKAVLIGPGRWGTTTPSLGVPVNFMEICNFISISEVAYNEQGLQPELSYGSHFFQDMVEMGTLYTALYREQYDVIFNEELLTSFPNAYNGNETGELKDVIGVYDMQNKNLILYSEFRTQKCLLGFSKQGGNTEN